MRDFALGKDLEPTWDGDINERRERDFQGHPALKEAFADHMDRTSHACPLCQYKTGVRAGELVGLTFNDLFLDERELRVFGKGRRERMLPVTAQLAAALKRWVAVHPTREGPHFVGIRYTHNPLQYYGAWLVVKKALARAGLAGRKFRPHKLRHTFANRLLSRKVELDKIQKLPGHRRIDTTTIYAHTKIESGLADRMGEAL